TIIRVRSPLPSSTMIDSQVSPVRSTSLRTLARKRPITTSSLYVGTTIDRNGRWDTMSAMVHSSLRAHACPEAVRAHPDTARLHGAVHVALRAILPPAVVPG